MITKGYVIKKSTDSSNKYSVRIPILESAGIGLNSNGLNSSVYDCTLSHNPGTYEALRPGDCVFISFEDNNYAKPIILGKLFVNVEEESSGYQYNTDLKVTHKATLPIDTTIGSVPFDNILNYFNSINESIDRLSTQSPPSLSANLILYPTNASSDVSGYFKMVTNIDNPSYNTTAVNIPTGIINTDNQLLASLVSEPGFIIGNPGVINITTIGNIKRTVGNNNQYAAFYFTISKRDISGAETLLTTSNETPDIIIGNIYEEFSAAALLNNGEFLNTDRIVIKYYADLTGNTGSSYDFQFGGTNPVRTLLPVPISSIPSPKASNIITDTTTFNGILSSADNTVQKALNTLDDHNHNSLYYTETEVDTLLSGKSGTGHLHDDRYYTETETNTLLSGKSNTDHLHDDRYYTETESDSRFLQLSGGTVTGTLTLPQNTVGTTFGNGVSTSIPYKISQVTGDNDAWSIYGESSSTNTVTMVFQLEDDIETSSTSGWLFRNKKTYGDYAATSPMFIRGDGNVGIGTATPNELLEVSGSGLTYAKISSGTNTSFRGVAFGVANDSTVYGNVSMEVQNGELRHAAGFSTWGGFQTFYTNGSERMRIASDGNVGIGTTSPQTKLEIYGGHSDTLFRLFANNGPINPQSSLHLWASEPGLTYDGAGIGSNVANSVHYGKLTNSLPSSAIRFFDGDFKFLTSPATSEGYSERFTIKRGGDVGIGTGAPGAKLEVNGNALIRGPLLIDTGATNGNFNEGIRLAPATNGWTGIAFNGTGFSGAPSWFVARNPSNQFIIASGDSSTSSGLALNSGGNMTWRGNNVWSNINGSGGIRFLSGGTVQNNVLFTVSGSTLTINTTTDSAI
jgi:hypothetical protein